jgi:hypothetical protein
MASSVVTLFRRFRRPKFYISRRIPWNQKLAATKTCKCDFDSGSWDPACPNHWHMREFMRRAMETTSAVE